MLSSIKHYLSTEEGVQAYGIFSLMVFVLFFLAVIIRIIRMRKSTIDEVSAMPLGDDDSINQNSLL
jgi:cytochrome c oxidase cbb3-type subunit IV